MLDKIVPVIVTRYPAIIPHLGGWFFKSYDFYLRTLQNMVRNVYDGYLGGEFRDILSALVLGQLSDAFETAARDNDLLELTQDMFRRMMEMVNSERTHIDDFYRAIVDARIDGSPLDTLLQRAELWARRWQEAYNEAEHMITLERGGKEVWILGETEEHCPTCAALNGIVAFASEWEAAKIRPKAPPNPILSCGGWRCDCQLVPTEKRRSPKALSRLFDIAAGARL